MTMLLILIYAAFISMGLPDSMLGSAWPAMQADLNAPLAMCGYIGFVGGAGNLVSSLLSNRLITRFGAGRVTAFSVTLTALALLGYSMCTEVWMVFVCVIPLGLGGGCIDAALNNYIALHFEAKHMNWLHCFWGFGATIGPVILSVLLGMGYGWGSGYAVVAALQFVLAAVTFVSLPVWKRAAVREGIEEAKEEEKTFVSNREALRVKGVWISLLGFLLCCATETTCGMWAATYLNKARGMSVEQAALGSSLFYAFITIGRVIAGFAAVKIRQVRLIRYGQILCLAGAVLMLMPLPAAFGMAGVAMIGFGAAPINPNMIHVTPERFGEKNSQAVMGLQITANNLGCSLVPPLFGMLAGATTLHLYSIFLFVCTLGMLVCCEVLARRTAR